MDCAALIVAAGSGQRAGSGVPKQYRLLCGEPVLRRTIEAFAGMAARVVIDPAHRQLYDQVVGGGEPIAGGASRQESVLRGLEALAADPPSHVLIHDAARPLVSAAVIARVRAALESHEGAVAAMPITDTVHRLEAGRLEQLDRAGLWRAQTPQGFHFAAILAAHRAAAGLALTDDAAVAARAGLAVTMVEGAEDNIKITTDEDFRRAEQLLASRLGDIRVGSGFDVHRFGPGDHVMLCGVRIAHDAGLVGHSDADAGLHALTDAVLGALAAGDIGQHFPPSDARWKGADSAQFLAHAAGLVAARGGVIGHVDVTLICERPRIGPHRAAMADRVGAILGIDASRVGIKATTTEGLGFTGRGEGIAAQATATVRLPW